jgi:hypothetical protein
VSDRQEDECNECLASWQEQEHTTARPQCCCVLKAHSNLEVASSYLLLHVQIVRCLVAVDVCERHECST